MFCLFPGDDVDSEATLSPGKPPSTRTPFTPPMDTTVWSMLRSRCGTLPETFTSVSAVIAQMTDFALSSDDALAFWRAVAVDLIQHAQFSAAAAASGSGRKDSLLIPMPPTSIPFEQRPCPPAHRRSTAFQGLRYFGGRAASFATKMGGTPSALVSKSPVTTFTKAEVGDEEVDGSYSINQHVVLMPLGQGTQGEVVLAMDTKKNELRAIKVVPRPSGIHLPATGVTRGALGAAKAARREQLEREIAIMKHCRHRNLVTLHEVIDDPELDVMYLVMQYVEKGPIAKLRPDGTIEKPIDAIKLAGYTVQLCDGLAYLHRKGVIHRDIKPDNVLIGAHDDVYLADFGTSDIFCGDESRRVLGHRGTMTFMAPELLHGGDDAEDDEERRVNGEAVDVWALGVTLYVLFYGKLPWKAQDVRHLHEEISEGAIEFVVPAQADWVPDDSQSNDLSGTPSACDTVSFCPIHDVSFPDDEDSSSCKRSQSSLSPRHYNATRLARDFTVLLSSMLDRRPQNRPPLREIKERVGVMLSALRDSQRSVCDSMSTSAMQTSVAIIPRYNSSPAFLQF